MSTRAACLVIAVALSACGDVPATIEFVSVTPAHPRIGEIATVQFRLNDYRGTPMAGTTVTFRALPAPGSKEGVPGVTVTPPNAISVKGSGTVDVQVVSSAVSAVTIEAKAPGNKTALSPPITFAGSVPNAAQFTFQCGPFSGQSSGGIHNIGTYDQARNLIAGVKLKCTAHAGDRNGDGVPGVLVSFLAEAGTIGPSETTMTDHNGDATIEYVTTYPLPADTDPITFSWAKTVDDIHIDEYSVPLWMEPFTWTTNPVATLGIGTPAYNKNSLQEPRRRDPTRVINGMAPQNNPRDNLVTLIAYTAGEEAFIDKNADGTFGTDEQSVDLTEPFVDANDNGTYDMDEKYIDTNGSGDWTGKCGTEMCRWDANTLIWRQEKIIWSGIPFGRLYDNQPDDYQAPEPIVIATVPLVGTNLIKCFATRPFEVVVADPWFNSMAQNGAGDGCRGAQNSPNVTVSDTTGFGGFAFTYPPARKYTFTVSDALERMPAGGTGCFPPLPAPSGSVPQEWFALVACDWTASPEDSHTVTIPFFAGGTITNNLPNVPVY